MYVDELEYYGANRIRRRNHGHRRIMARDVFSFHGDDTPTNTDPGFFDNVGNFFSNVGSGIVDAGKAVVSAPGKIIATNLEEVGAGAGGALQSIGTGAGSTVSNVTKPLIPVLIIAGAAIVAGGYFYMKSSKVSITNVPR